MKNLICHLPNSWKQVLRTDLAKMTSELVGQDKNGSICSCFCIWRIDQSDAKGSRISEREITVLTEAEKEL